MMLTTSIIVLLLASLAYLVWSVRRQATPDRERAEAEALLLSESDVRSVTPVAQTRVVLVGAMVFVIIGSIFLYDRLGFARDVAFVSDLQTGQLSAEKSTSYLEYRSLRYGDYSDWFYLAEHYESTGDYQKAEQAYQESLARFPSEADDADKAYLLSRYAQAMFFAQNKTVTDALERLIQETLLLNPDDSQALGLAGVIAFEQGDFAGAFEQWGKAFRFGQTGRERMALLQAMTKAKGLLPPEEAQGVTSNPFSSGITHAIYLQLNIPNDVQLPADTVFLVYAKTKDLPYPVSVQRVSLNDTQEPLLLTNLDYMMAGKTLADYNKVDILVRMSRMGVNESARGRIVGQIKDIPTQPGKIFELNVVL